MSRPHIFRDGTVAAQSFSASLPDLDIPQSAKKRSSNDITQVRARMLESAHAEGLVLGREEGFEAGKLAGYQAGFDQAYAEASNKQSEMLREFAAELQKVHDNLQESITEWFQVSEKELEEMAVSIAEHLVGTQLQLDRSFVIESTKAALQQISEATRARIRVNPFDCVILRNAREELLSATATLRGIEVVDDDTIYGGCVIETERGAIDATIEKRLELLQGGLEEVA